MNSFIVKILITTLTVAAVGYFTSMRVQDVIRLRRCSSLRRVEQMIMVANLNNGYLGMHSSLVLL